MKINANLIRVILTIILVIVGGITFLSDKSNRKDIEDFINQTFQQIELTFYKIDRVKHITENIGNGIEVNNVNLTEDTESITITFQVHANENVYIIKNDDPTFDISHPELFKSLGKTYLINEMIYFPKLLLTDILYFAPSSWAFEKIEKGNGKVLTYNFKKPQDEILHYLPDTYKKNLKDTDDLNIAVSYIRESELNEFEFKEVRDDLIQISGFPIQNPQEYTLSELNE
jgi:hypothetical protein